MIRFAIALAALMLATAPAVADEMPIPRLFRDAPFQKGQWKVEMLEMNMPGAEGPHGTPRAMTLCMKDLREMSRDRAQEQGEEQPNCSHRLLKDTATEAVMETTCKNGKKTLATVTREGDKTFLVRATGTRGAESYSMKARYTYEGAQCTHSGTGFSMDKNSPECQKARAQLSNMNPGAMCANAGANRAMCEQNLQRMRSQLEAMCN